MRFVEVDRRSFLIMTGALGVGALARPWRALAQDRSTLRIRFYSDLQVLDPLNRLAEPAGDIMDAIFSNLVTAKPGKTWDWQLDAAESIERVDERHIKKGIRFTGGLGELTADDVKFSFEQIAEPNNESPYKDDWAALDRVEVKDPYFYCSSNNKRHGRILAKHVTNGDPAQLLAGQEPCQFKGLVDCSRAPPAPSGRTPRAPA
jgi:peptide/nickel transport system substrate-binding protein